jgi:tyrosine-protein kinase Etk/Wzc
VESLRSLRTSLQFALMDAGNRVIAIHGVTPGVGKTFVATNLAALLADGNAGSVLVVDADLRKGHLHERLGMPKTPGLSELLSGTSTLADAVREVEPGRLFVLATGTFPPNPAEVLMHANLAKLLAEAQQRFRYVILDCPPLLNLADAMILARHAGTNFLTVRGGQTTRHDVDLAQQRFKQSEVSLRGVIFNGLNLRASAYYYGTQAYGQRYTAARDSQG